MNAHVDPPVRQQEFERFQREARISSVQTADPDTREFEVVWTAGAKVKRRRRDWRTGDIVEFEESLSMDPSAVRMERLSSGQSPLLDSHWGYDLRDVIGVVKSAEIRDGKGYARCRFSKRNQDMDGLWRDVQDGIIVNISVGYNVHRWEVTMAADGKPEQRTAVDWEPMELSLVPIGADPDCKVRGERHERGERGQKPETVLCEIVYRTQPEKENAMSGNTQKSGAGAAGTAGTAGTAEPENNADEAKRAADKAAADQAAADEAKRAAEKAAADASDKDKAVREARETERSRIADINEAVRAFGFEPDIAQPFIEKGTDINKVRAALQERLAEQSDRTSQRNRVSAGSQNTDDTRRRLAENALECRANPGDRSLNLEDGARQFRGLTLMEMARDYVAQEGGDLSGMSRMEVASVALGLTRAPGMHSTSDFPLILANVANKRLRAAYDAAPETWRPLGRQSNNTDFKAKHVAALSEAPRLKKVVEGAEFTYGAFSEAGTSYRLATYGRIIALTRQAIINDDLSAFERIPTQVAMAAQDLQADMVWGMLLSNPTMYDGTALFHADHKNLITPAAAISVSSVSTGRKQMRQQKNIGDKQIINVMASYLVVPSALETVAEQFLSTTVVPIKDEDINVFKNTLTQITEPRLDLGVTLPDNSTVAGSATAWYLAASPDRVDTFEYSYLEGEQGLFTETRQGFEVDGVEIKARLDFASAFIDWKGWQKNNGA